MDSSIKLSNIFGNNNGWTSYSTYPRFSADIDGNGIYINKKIIKYFYIKIMF